MDWTDALPSEPGWYWVTHGPDDKRILMVIKVIFKIRGQYFWVTGASEYDGNAKMYNESLNSFVQRVREPRFQIVKPPDCDGV